MTIRNMIKRDIGVKVEGVVKVFDHAALATEIREYIVTDKIEAELRKIFDTFTMVSETLRRGGVPRDVMGVWVSGFFGSGKSHFAKVLGYLLQNDTLDATTGETCIDTILKQLSDSPRGKDIRLRLGEIKLNTQIKTIPFEIRSRQSLHNPNSVGEILLSEFYRSIGYSENFVVARIERRMAQRNRYAALEDAYRESFGVDWKSAEGRDDLMTVRRRLAEILPGIDPADFPGKEEAKRAIHDIFQYEKITAEGIANELVAWVDEQKPAGGRTQHLVFVVDEVGTFIGDSNEKIGELNSIAEMVGNKGKGKVWMVVTSQQDLEKVVDRTNFQPALVGRLNARFELKPHLISDEINKVVAERILKKFPSEEPALSQLYRKYEGHIAQLADLKASRSLGVTTERIFIDCYPFLPHQIRLAQDIFEKLSGFRISGGVRSMISVVMDALQEMADEEIGTLVSFDMVFDAVENDLLSQEYLGGSGVRSIYESDERLPGTPIEPSRVLKVLWLIQRIPWIPRVPETIAKLLVRNCDQEIPALRAEVEETLKKLQDAGYISRDEATGEWKFLNERERTIEQAIQEMVRPGGANSISIAAVRRTSQQLAKSDLVIKRKLANFTVVYGATKVPFAYGVHLDGEAIETGPELEVHFFTPLAPGRRQEIEEIQQKNQLAGAKGAAVWWVASVPEDLEGRLKRYEALVKVTGDKRFTEDSSSETQDALAEKRRERDELRSALVKDLERAFLSGTVYCGGQEVAVEGTNDLKEPVAAALTSVIPNIYSRFPMADRPYDFEKQLKGLLNPAATALHKIAPSLDLFDTQGSLQRESALVAQMIEVLKDLEDEAIEPQGAILLENREHKGFKGFSRPPFGWPEEVVRLVLAACFRAGAVYLERQTPNGPSPLYDYTEDTDSLAKISVFKKVSFHVAETSLSVAQIKAAGRALVELEVTGTSESGNAIASAVRKLGQNLRVGLQEARSRSEMGLPVSDAVLKAEGALNTVVSAKDPTKVVLAFLTEAETWKALHAGIKKLRSFIEAGRYQEYDLSRKLAELIATHPLPPDHPLGGLLERSLRDRETIIATKEVVDRWSDYRSAYETAHANYREAYRSEYEGVRAEAEATIEQIKDGRAYQAAPAERRDAIVAAVFGIGGPCYLPILTLDSVSSLLAAATKHSLASLGQTRMALPGYLSRVEADLQALVEPPPPREKIWEWRPATLFSGKYFSDPEELDRSLKEAVEVLKEKMRQGFKVIIK